MNRPLPLPPAANTDSVRQAAKAVAEYSFANADDCDHDGAFPEREVAELRRSGLLKAPLPRALGGVEPSGMELAEWLRLIGAGNLPLGRLYEGHVNALGLVLRYGDDSQASQFASEAEQGELFGVWNTDDRQGLRLISEGARFRLEGRKILCSGAGWIRRPLVTATDGAGRRRMVSPRLEDGGRADLSEWTVRGMRASATGAVDFTGLSVTSGDIIGEADDYERQPFFSGGAWRFCAVQQGGMEKLFDLLRQHLNRTGRGADPHQAARLGEAGIAVETARLWVEQAARMAEFGDAESASERIVAYVNLARIAVERAALELMQLVDRSVGLQAFVRPHPIERVARDLATYLRQPAPDRALTNGAAWVLAQKASTFELWT